MVRKNAGKKKEWADFDIFLESAVQRQEKELGMGVFRLGPDFKHPKKDAHEWIGMTSAQRASHIKSCLTNLLDTLAKSRHAEPEITDCDCLFITFP